MKQEVESVHPSWEQGESGDMLLWTHPVEIGLIGIYKIKKYERSSPPAVLRLSSLGNMK